ncbi:MAG: cyclic nucleotide-binding domain-containing protein [Cyclonatronaceae bacterium]
MFNSKKLDQIKAQGRVIFKASFLENLSATERYEFLQLCHKRFYKADEYIYYQGDPGTGMYLIEEGQVELKVEGENEVPPEIFILNSPEAFGMLSLSHEMRRLSTARCVNETKLLGFFRPDLERLQDRHPKIAIKLHDMLNILLARQLHTAINNLEKVTGKTFAYSLILEEFYSKTVAADKDKTV